MTEATKPANRTLCRETDGADLKSHVYHDSIDHDDTSAIQLQGKGQMRPSDRSKKIDRLLEVIREHQVHQGP